MDQPKASTIWELATEDVGATFDQRVHDCMNTLLPRNFTALFMMMMIVIIIYFELKWGFAQWEWYYNKTTHKYT
jgi:hypothetical protein